MIDAPTGLVFRSSVPESSSKDGGRLLNATLDTFALLGSIYISVGAFSEMALLLAVGASPVGITIVAIVASMEATRNVVNLLSNLADERTAEAVHRATHIVTLPGFVSGVAIAVLTQNEDATLESAKVANMLYTLGSLEGPLEEGIFATLKQISDLKEFHEWFEELLEKEQRADWVDIHFNQNTFIVPHGLEAGDRTASYKVVV